MYISPYHANVGGVPTLVICDDFADDTYPNESWMATRTDFSDLTQTRNTIQWNLDAADQQQDYTEAAWLTEQLLSVYSINPNDTVTLGEISFAIWGVFDNAAIPYLAANDSGAGYENCANGACYWLSQAQSLYASNSITLGQFSNFTVYSPTNTAPTCPGGCPSSPPQEFLTVTTPEPSAPALLGVYLSGLVALIILFRRRAVRATN